MKSFYFVKHFINETKFYLDVYGTINIYIKHYNEWSYTCEMKKKVYQKKVWIKHEPEKYILPKFHTQ